VIAGCAGGVAALAGCSTLASESATFDLVLYNRDDEAYEVSLRVHRPDDRFRHERVASETVDVEPDEEVRLDAIAERGPDVVQYEVYTADAGVETDDDHVHFFPRDEGDAALVLDIEESGEINQRG
jgi:hypothetical protein